MLFPPTDIKLFYKKENAENFACSKVLEKLQELELEEAQKMSWEEIQLMSDIWFKGKYIPKWYDVEIEEMEIE